MSIKKIIIIAAVFLLATQSLQTFYLKRTIEEIKNSSDNDLANNVIFDDDIQEVKDLIESNGKKVTLLKNKFEVIESSSSTSTVLSEVPVKNELLRIERHLENLKRGTDYNKLLNDIEHKISTTNTEDQNSVRNMLLALSDLSRNSIDSIKNEVDKINTNPSSFFPLTHTAKTFEESGISVTVNTYHRGDIEKQTINGFNIIGVSEDKPNRFGVYVSGMNNFGTTTVFNQTDARLGLFYERDKFRFSGGISPFNPKLIEIGIDRTLFNW